MDYIREAIGEISKGIITCGSVPGYENKTKISLEKLITNIEKINEEFADEKRITIPCIIREGVLVGRASDSNYREDIYTIEFLQSPRVPNLPKEELYDTLLEYAKRIGECMGQERIYIEFDGKTEVLKNNNL